MPATAETDREPAEITWIGRSDGGKPDDKIWTGSISAEAEMPARLHEYMAQVPEYFITAKNNQPVRCIDGRGREGTLQPVSREHLAEQHYGPQTPGGSAVAAWAHRIAGDKRLPAGNNANQDQLFTMSLYTELGLPFPVGGHEDCGAINKMPEIMDRLVDERSKPVIKGYVQAIVGEDFSEEGYKEVMQSAAQLNDEPYKNHYLQKVEDDYKYRELSLDAVRSAFSAAGADKEGLSPVEKPHGSHKEVLAVINKVRGTTFHRDLFCFDNQNTAQVFNYDYWHTVDRADALYGDDSETRARFLMARTAYAVSALMVLTDGSLQIGIRGSKA